MNSVHRVRLDALQNVDQGHWYDTKACIGQFVCTMRSASPVAKQVQTTTEAATSLRQPSMLFKRRKNAAVYYEGGRTSCICAVQQESGSVPFHNDPNTHIILSMPK